MWATRRVSRADEPAWVRLCRASAGEDDYVLNYLAHFLDRAVTHVALDGDRFIGTMTYAELLDGGAWLSAARTLPEYRGRGVASDLVHVFETYARSRGRMALRLWTAASNEAGVATFRKNGLLEVARFTRLAAESSRATSGTRLGRLPEDEDLWSRVASSHVFRAAKGYVPHGYGFIKVRGDVLTSLAKEGVLFGWNEQAAVVSGPSEGYEEDILEVAPLSGDLAALLAEARIHAAAQGKPRIETFLPHDPVYLEAARRVGFTTMSWGREAILCEKTLG